MKKKLICFDLDGTLIYSDPAHIRAYQETFERNNLRYISKRKLIALFGIPGELFVSKLFPDLSKEKIKKLVGEHDELVVRKTNRYVKKVRGVNRTLKKLRRNYVLALVSNCKTVEMRALLNGAGIDKNLFRVILGNDKVRKAKPFPDEILKIEHLTRMNAEYMVGDTIYDIKAGKRAKTKTIAVLTGTTHTKKDLEKEKPYKILRSIRSLPRFLKKEERK